MMNQAEFDYATETESEEHKSINKVYVGRSCCCYKKSCDTDKNIVDLYTETWSVPDPDEL